jgi:hypothetical protein
MAFRIPCGLNAFPRAFKSCKAWAGLLAQRTAALPGYGSNQQSHTVARPRGILTRFPILPILGHPDTFNCKEQILPGFDSAGHYHAF